MRDHNKIVAATETLKAEFLDEVGELLRPSSKKGTALLNFLQGRGHQLKLRSVDPYELLSDATMRGLNYIETHKQGIQNVHAWLRRVCLYILADMVKAEKRDRYLHAKNSVFLETDNPFMSIESEEEKHFLKNALTQLSDADQELLDLRYFQNQTYKGIQQLLAGRGTNIKLPTLRKRGARALERLRTVLKEEYKTG